MGDELIIRDICVECGCVIYISSKDDFREIKCDDCKNYEPKEK